MAWRGSGVRIPLAPRFISAGYIICRDFFILFSPRRNSVCLSLSRTNNEHHRPEVALNKSSKYELGKALITYKRGERRSLLLISKGSELGLGLINQVLSQRFGIRCGALSTRTLLLVLPLMRHKRRKNE